MVRPERFERPYIQKTKKTSESFSHSNKVALLLCFGSLYL